MKHIKMKHYSDDSHGWIAIKRSILEQLGLLDKISAYSYQSKTGQTVYLEEDSDASKLVNALDAKGLVYQNESVRHDGQSWIRSLPRFETKVA